MWITIHLTISQIIKQICFIVHFYKLRFFSTKKTAEELSDKYQKIYFIFMIPMLKKPPAYSHIRRRLSSLLYLSAVHGTVADSHFNPLSIVAKTGPKQGQAAHMGRILFHFQAETDGTFIIQPKLIQGNIRYF